MKKLTELEIGDQFNGSKILNIFPVGQRMAVIETAKVFAPYIEGESIGMYCYTFEQALIALVTYISGYDEAYGFICRMLELSGDKENE